MTHFLAIVVASTLNASVFVPILSDAVQVTTRRFASQLFHAQLPRRTHDTDAAITNVTSFFRDDAI